MSEKYSIGLDFGTLSGRAVLVRVSDGAELADAVMNYPHGVMDDTLAATGEKLPHDFALQDARDYLEVLHYIVPTVLRESGVDPDDIVGVGVDFTCCTVVPIYEDGTPLSFDEKFANNKHAYVKLWKHHAAQEYADRLNELAARRGDTWPIEYGGRCSSEWLYPKVWEIYDKAPEIYRAAYHFIEAGEWITMYLTGKLTKSYTFATAKAIYNKETGYPPIEMFAEMDEGLRNVVAEKIDSPIVYSGKSAGNICEKAANELGLSQKTVVSAPMPDAHVATVALDMCHDGDMCAIMGTSGCYMLISDKYEVVPGICGTHMDSLTPGFWGYEAGLCAVGDLFAWASDKLAPAEYRDAAEKEGIPVLQYMINRCAAKRPGETGLVALDWHNGNRNILVDARLSGMIVGMTLQTTADDILRAMLEATAFATRVIFENYTSHGVEIKRLIAAGGIARKDPFTMQLYADILGMDIAVASSPQVPARASAVYATAAAGYDLYECISRMSSPMEKVYHPNPEAKAIYDRIYAEYLRLHDYFGRGGSDCMYRLHDIKLGN